MKRNLKRDFTMRILTSTVLLIALIVLLSTAIFGANSEATGYPVMIVRYRACDAPPCEHHHARVTAELAYRQVLRVRRERANKEPYVWN